MLCACYAMRLLCYALAMLCACYAMRLLCYALAMLCACYALTAGPVLCACYALAMRLQYIALKMRIKNAINAHYAQKMRIK
jgi:hypothetical protein